MCAYEKEGSVRTVSTVKIIMPLSNEFKANKNIYDSSEGWTTSPAPGVYLNSSDSFVIP